MTAEKRFTLILSAGPDVLKQIDALLSGKQAAAECAAIPRVIRRKEVATLLGVSQKRVDQICAAGGLVRVFSPGASRAMGFSEASVRSLVEGRTGKAVA